MSRENILVILLVSFGLIGGAWAAVPTTLNDFFLPGSQPGQSGNLETPDKCDNCHGGYDSAVEPAFSWRGSMMSQAARDPLFYACMTIGNQDASEVGDLCIRCHSPAGWLEGRSTPTDGSALNSNDREGVQCDFCHKKVRPTPIGVNPYPDDPDYTSDTYPQDQSYLSTLAAIPESCGNGMYVADSDNAKRGPFLDANAKHQMFYSPFHSDMHFCGTCHDVSNPAFTKDIGGAYVPNSFDQPAPDFDPYSMFPIERTFSEWLMSEYNSAQGVYAPQFGGNKDTVSTCQDCHMRDVTGLGCNKQGVPIRQDLPLHDQTGGNTFIPRLIESLYPGEADTAALSAGIQRATYMLQNAATMSLSVTEQSPGYLAQVHIINETGHKLPSGYPEGRRMWINVRALDNTGTLIYESGAYEPETGILTHDPDINVYEIKPGISNALAPIVNLPAGPSFHFVINDTIYKDNRIPPRGFTNANFETIQSPPVAYTYSDNQYWDDTQYQLPDSTAEVTVTLYYQSTSKEYVEFLRDENVTNDWGNVLYNLWANNGKSSPVAMATETYIIEPLDNPPVLDSIGPKTVDEGQVLQFRISATDPDGDSIVLLGENLPANASFFDSANGAGLFSFNPDYTQAGVYPVLFIASAGSSADSDEVEITVNNVNRAPVADAGPDQLDVEVGQLVTLDGSSSYDPDGDSIGYHWSQTAGPVTTLSDTNAIDPAFTPGLEGNYRFQLMVDDGVLASSPDTVLVSVANQAPVLDSIGAKSVDEGDTLEFGVWATDADGDSIILSTGNLPANASFEDSGNGAGSFLFTPGYDQAADYQVVFIASDGGLADSEEVTITVNDVQGFLCGDANADGSVGLGDAIYVLNYLFRDGPAPTPIEAADVDLDGVVALGDAIYLLNYLFRDGPTPCEPI
jgi:hypothetical protein